MTHLSTGSRIAAAVCSAAFLSVASPVMAADSGLYLEGRAGFSIPADADLDTATTSQKIEFDNGVAGSLAFGNAYPNGLRAELEVGYRRSDVDSVSGGGTGTGDVSAWSVMGNALYDLRIDTPLKPYFGVGLGIARLDADGAVPSAGVTINDTDTAFAWQAMAGVAYNLNDQVKLTVGYRYFAVPDADFTSSAGTRFDSDYASHDLMVGLRYSFGAPARKMAAAEPAPMPAPTPAPVAAAPEPEPAPPPPKPAPPPVVRNYLVFFDFDRASITTDAQAIIESAAKAAKSVAPVRLRVTGHADRAGRQGYNQRLSQRRAVAVRASLIRLGVPADDIAVFAKGETEPLVPTADGVREPQNRRVQIVLE